MVTEDEESPGKLTGQLISFGRSNCRGLSCLAAADSSSSGFRDPAAISSTVNSKSARSLSCSEWNEANGAVLPAGGKLVLPAADDDARYFVCSLWRLRELQFDAVSSSWD